MKLSFVISQNKTKFEAGSQTKDLCKTLRYMKGLGFDGAELAIRNPKSFQKEGVKNIDMEISAIGTGQAYLEEGLSLSHYNNEIRKKAIKRIYEHINLASALESKVIIGLIRGNLGGGNFNRSIQKFRDSLNRCLSFAEKQKVTLLIEPINRYECNFLNTISQTVSLIRDYKSPRLKLLVDSFHMNIEEQDMCEGILSASSLIEHVHFADSNRLYPGMGHINFKDLIKTFKKIGYKEFISGEIIPKPNEKEAMINFINFMKKNI